MIPAILIKDTVIYQVDTEQQAQELVDTAIKSQYTDNYKLINHSVKYKNKKAKGDIVAEWYEVTLTRSYDVE